MTKKVFELLSFIFLLLLVLSGIGHAKRNIPSDKKSSSFEFINELKDCRKGNNTKGIHQLKIYLQKFGYLETDLTQTHDANDVDNYFNDALESAIKTYQQNFHIKPTGILDATTISKMTAPRCGVPDIINGTNYMQSHNRNLNHDSSSSSSTIHTVSHYSFFPGNPKWPPSQTHLTYGFLSNTLTDAMDPVVSAFQIWASATQFTFSEAENNENPDLVIGFYSGDHGDGSPFDGPLGTLAHAFPPTDGRFHYDADEQWSVGAVPGKFDLESVAVHEIGHLLGLGHSQVQEAIMHPGISPGEVKLNLQQDDIDGIRALYGV